MRLDEPVCFLRPGECASVAPARRLAGHRV
jgi:hypothetical protein